MDKTVFTPEDSLLIIAKTIEQTKERFIESRFIYLFWGFLMFFVTISQFLIIQLELRIGTGFPTLLYPLGGIFTFIYVWKSEKKNNLPKTLIGNIIAGLGSVIGMNFIILGFFFRQEFGSSLIPVFLILLAFWTIITGVAIKFKPSIIGGVILNLIAFIPFFIDWQYHYLIMSIGAVVALIIPGFLLNKNREK